MAIINAPSFHDSSPFPLNPLPNGSFPFTLDQPICDRQNPIETRMHLLHNSIVHAPFPKPIEKTHFTSLLFFSLEKVKELIDPLKKIALFLSTFSFYLPMAKADDAHCHVYLTHSMQQREKFEHYLEILEQELEELKNGNGNAPLFKSLTLEGFMDREKQSELNAILLKETWTNCNYSINYDSTESLKTLARFSHLCELQFNHAECSEIDLKLKLYEIVYKLTEAHQNIEPSPDFFQKSEPLKEVVINAGLFLLGGFCATVFLNLRGLFLKKTYKNHPEHFEKELQPLGRQQPCKQISSPLPSSLQLKKGRLTSSQKPMQLKPIHPV